MSEETKVETGENLSGWQFQGFLERECQVGQWGHYDYEWNLVAVYRHPGTGKLWMASGMGCSCNSLLDDVNRWEDLRPLNSLKAFAEALEDLGSDRPTGEEFIRALAKVKKAMKMGAASE